MAKAMSVFVEIGGKIGGSFIAAIDTAEGRLKRLSAVHMENAAAARTAASQIGESYKGLAGMAAAGGLVFSVKHAFEGGEELAHELQALKNAGRSSAEVADGLREANKAIADMPTATLTNGIKILNETTGAYGDYKHAVENLAFNSKLGDVLKNSLHVEDPSHELGSLIKALEIRGSASNPEKYKREAELLGQAMVFYGGRLKSDDIYTFASNAQVGIKQLDERFLTKIAPALIQEMGGDKVGTGLTAFRTIISGRKISNMPQAKAWADLGLLNSKDVITNKKTGEVKGWKDGAIKDTALAYQDPMAFLEKDILPRLKRRGTDITDPIKLGAALNTLFQNTKANAFVTAISTVVDRARLKKDEDLIGKVLSIDENYNQSKLNDPKLAAFAIKSSMDNIGSALTLPLMKPFAQMMISIAQSVNHVSAALIEHPEIATLIAKIGAGLFVWQTIRVANFVLGIGSMARMLANLSIAAPLGLAARLIGISRAIITFTAASSAATAVRSFAGATAALALAAPAALAVRLRATAAGVMALYAAGGAQGVLAALAGSIVGVGRAVLLFPLLQLRSFGAALVAMPLVRLRATVAGIMALQAVGGTGAVFSALAASLASFAKAPFLFIASGLRLVGLSMWSLVANPVGLVLAGIVAGLAALGLWIANNWGGIVSFFGAFGSAFMGALGPGASGAIEKVVGWLGAAWRWVSNLLGPIDATGERWKAWGASAGAAAAAVVNGLLYLPTEIAKIAKAMWDSLVNFDWLAAGASIAGAVGRGLGGLAMAPVDWLKGKLGVGQATAPAGTPVAGARAAGGPVGRGLPYLVGENGPEIFVPGASGQISTNGALRRLASARGSGDEDGGNVETVRALRGMSFALAGSLDGLARAINRLDANGEKGGTDDVGGAGGGGLGGGFSGGRRGFMARAGHFGGRRGFMKNGVATTDYGTPSKSLLDFIAKSEGTRGYDTSLGFGKFLPGHHETDLQGKSLTDILALGRSMRQQPGNPNSSALGRYQFTGETIRDLMGRMHLSGAEKFDGPMQDAMASRLIHDEGPRALGRWASLTGGKMDTARGLLAAGQVAPMPTDAGAAASAGKLVADNGKGVALPNGESGGHMRGKLALDGKAYDFGSGGNRGANSIPMGDYEITPNAIGSWGKANGAIGVANGRIWDKTLGRMREGIELHAAHSANMISSGCLAFAKGQFDDVKSHVLKMVQEKGHAYLHVGSNGASITPTKAPPSAMAAAPEKKDAAPKTAMAEPAPAIKVAGARAMGGSVGAGLSYLVGERGPEIFSPGASGQISTNGTLSRLTDIGRRVIEGSGEKIAPEAGRVAAARPGPAGSGAGSAGGRGGDTTYHAGEHHWNIKASDPKGVREEVERTMMGIIAQFESTQRGSLSD